MDVIAGHSRCRAGQLVLADVQVIADGKRSAAKCLYSGQTALPDPNTDEFLPEFSDGDNLNYNPVMDVLRSVEQVLGYRLLPDASP